MTRRSVRLKPLQHPPATVLAQNLHRRRCEFRPHRISSTSLPARGARLSRAGDRFEEVLFMLPPTNTLMPAWLKG